jgi:preprotein translocase subunit YajC
MEANNDISKTAVDYARLVFHTELGPIVIYSLAVQQETLRNVNNMSFSSDIRSNHEERRALLSSSEYDDRRFPPPSHNVSYGTPENDTTTEPNVSQHSIESSDGSWIFDAVLGGEDGGENDASESPSAAPITPDPPAAAAAEDEESTDGDEQESRVSALTRRLRCLFSTITWPIVPLGTIVALALLWVLYAASSLDLRRTCSHPLHWYALASLTLVAYIPFHAQVRSHLFSYQRERDGPIRPARVRMFDQFFHTVCLLYVYTGVTLIQTCREDMVAGEDAKNMVGNEIAMPNDDPLNTCQATCPNLYQALSVYVATLEMFTFALILPLLFLPCIYLWFLRRATAEAEAFAQLQDRLQEEEALLTNGGVTTGEIMDSLENVKLVSRSDVPTVKSDDATNLPEEVDQEIWLLPYSATDASIGMKSDVKECCICMTDFPIHSEADLEKGLFQEDNKIGGNIGQCSGNINPALEASTNLDRSNNETPSVDLKECVIVRTRCGHVFHKECLYGWVGGRWQMNANANASDSVDSTSPDRRRRRARQTCCPLCREDLRPSDR